MRNHNINKIIFSTLFVTVLFLPAIAFGYDMISGDTIVISKKQSVDGNLYIAGQNITIDQNINGDIFCAGQSVTINGNVEGSVFCASQTIAINGNVKESVRSVGNTIMINKEIGKNVMALGAVLNVGQDARIGWDLFMGAGSATIRGGVGRSIHGGGGSVLIDSMVERDVHLELSDNSDNRKSSQPSVLRIGENARIGGNVVYRSQNQADIAEGAVIRGDVTKVDAVEKEKKKKDGLLAYMIGILYSILAALIVAFILIALFGNMVKRVTDAMMERIGTTIGWGALMTIVTPILIIVLMVTLVGIPLSLILLAVWLVALYISQILVGVVIGRKILKRNDGTDGRSLYLCALVGLIVSWIIFSLPIIGGLLWIVAVFWGIGGMWLAFKKD